MGIPHRHLYIGMSEYTLQDQNITTIHHKVTGEGVAQNVGKLPRWQFDACSFQRRPERAITITKQSTFFIIRQRVIKLFADGNGAVFLPFVLV